MLFAGTVVTAQVFSRPLKSASYLKGVTKAARHHFVMIDVICQKELYGITMEFNADEGGIVQMFHTSTTYGAITLYSGISPTWDKESSWSYEHSFRDRRIPFALVYYWASKFAVEEKYDLQTINCVAFARTIISSLNCGEYLRTKDDSYQRTKGIAKGWKGADDDVAKVKAFASGANVSSKASDDS